MGEEKQIINDEGFVAWVKSYKKQLIIAGIGIPTIIAIFAGIKNKEATRELWDSLKKEFEAAKLYSSGWFAKATDAELDLEREKVRLAYCASGNNFSEAGRLQNLLWRFDKEMSKRAWGGEVPHAPSIHREHGWYLPKDYESERKCRHADASVL